MTDFNEVFYTYRGYEKAAGSGRLTPSMEDYLEMIYRLSLENGYTRVNDIAEKLNVKPPSVTKMMIKLSDKELLIYEKYGNIKLTQKGEELGSFLLDRHNTVKEFFSLLGLTKNFHKDVEQIEHYIAKETFICIKSFVNFMKDNTDVKERYEKYLNEYKNNTDFIVE
ncbi:hypothetical protein SYNTR_0813 [Candidatus Syntrophocurvum alkaliphilum]|uniref:HTH dtxR-type domain-containing protein n=1 Tax=Candidatus Syntrophocurvum alkaliphilum TaxID=2293317 RepID=A0A6I6DDT7_9FIRM|nr:transcriptional regulator MntR [Candidatus Syntrophocurvum alkaliphilum]QGT99406.1 hypothetical protein SYNTR_0813 [Candidatus Syntrophocurvum alkaliphilum]